MEPRWIAGFAVTVVSAGAALAIVGMPFCKTGAVKRLQPEGDD